MAIKILDNCCSPLYLDYLKNIASTADNWNLKYPRGKEVSFEMKFPKIDIIANGIQHPFLAGLASGLLIQIYEVGGRGLFVPDIAWCGISIKDKHLPPRMHTDHEKSEGTIKVMGILNRDWKEEWGGGFTHDGMNYYIKPTSFCIFDSTELHDHTEIFTDKKRFAIDFTVFRDKQSLEKVKKLRK